MHTGNKTRGNLPELPNTMFMVVICCMSNSNNVVQSHKHLQALYTNVRYLEELVDFMNENGGLKEPYILFPMCKCKFEQNALDEAYMGIYTHRKMINDPIYGQI